MNDNLFYFIDQLGFEAISLIFTLTMTALMVGLMSKSFLYD